MAKLENLVTYRVTDVENDIDVVSDLMIEDILNTYDEPDGINVVKYSDDGEHLVSIDFVGDEVKSKLFKVDGDSYSDVLVFKEVKLSEEEYSENEKINFTLEQFKVLNIISDELPQGDIVIKDDKGTRFISQSLADEVLELEKEAMRNATSVEGLKEKKVKVVFTGANSLDGEPSILCTTLTGAKELIHLNAINEFEGDGYYE